MRVRDQVPSPQGPTGSEDMRGGRKRQHQSPSVAAIFFALVGRAGDIEKPRLGTRGLAAATHKSRGSAGGVGWCGAVRPLFDMSGRVHRISPEQAYEDLKPAADALRTEGNCVVVHCRSGQVRSAVRGNACSHQGHAHNLRFICGAPPKLVFDTGFFVHFPNTPPPSLFIIFATLYWVLGPPGLDSRGDGAASALQGATSRELRPTLSPPGCNRLGGGDLGSGVCGERGDL